MEVNKRNFPKKRPNFQFKRKGVNKKGKWQNSGHEQTSGNPHSADTVYRILCPVRKIGSVIGKGGTIVKALREETQAKITVADSVPRSDERVIIIYSSPAKVPNKLNRSDNSASEQDDENMEPHCPAQDALLKVHERIVEEDLFGGMAFDEDNENSVVTARLLVPNNMVGCLLGKKGDVIQKLRSETGAGLRVLPAEHLPTCAMNTDELVQISGKPTAVKRALYEVSTLLHQNPRKDKPPLSFPIGGGQSFHPGGAPMTNIPPPGNSMWAPRHSASPWMEEYPNQPPGFLPGGIGGEASGEFFMKILCSTAKIGGVIGKGGFNIKQLQHETGANIHVEDSSPESDERVISVSAFEASWNPISQTIEAILQLQNKTSEISEKGIMTTRLLVPSTKVGCLLGQGGHVINEMRRRLQADIRVYSKDDKPKCASEEEELVQVSGSFGIAKDALGEIASRLRARFLRDANSGGEPVPTGPVQGQGFGPLGSLPGRGPRAAGPIGPGSYGGYEPFKASRHEYEAQSFPVQPSAVGYPNVNSSIDVKVPNNAVGFAVGTGGSNVSNTGEVSGARLKLQDPQSGGSECVVEIRGSSEHLTAAQSILHAFISSGGSQHGPYQNANSQPGSYQSHSQQEGTHHNPSFQQGSRQIPNSQQGSYQNTSSQQGSYQNPNSQQGSYLNPSTQPALYQNPNAEQGSYQNLNLQQGSYQNLNPQQGSYQDPNSQQGSYPDPNAQQSSYHNFYPQQPYQNISNQHGAYQNISGAYQY